VIFLIEDLPSTLVSAPKRCFLKETDTRHTADYASLIRPTQTGRIDNKVYLKGGLLRNLVIHFCIAIFALMVSGCAIRSAVDKPLASLPPDAAQQITKQIVGNRSTDLLVMVAFSGGGTRAAAFAYGVLQELADTKMKTGDGLQTLLQEVDMISSVSGGSFTNAYYGLYGDKIFKDFEERFLRKDVQGYLLWQVFRPINWIRLLSSAYGKSDIAAKYYDKILFNDATFADLKRPGAPLAIMNATDLGTGMRIDFTKPTFNLLCADLDQYPISRAVTASSAVPGLFSTITIKNYGGTCGFKAPAWMDDARKDVNTTIRKQEAQGLAGYLDSKKQPWLHLVDGGVSDNLGLRSFFNMVGLENDPHKAFSKIGHADVRHILIISVDAHAKHKNKWALKSGSPSLLEMIGSVSATQITRYSADTIQLVGVSFDKWAKQMSTPEQPVSFNFVEVNFNMVKDENERNYLNDIGTSFELDDEHVDRLIAAARKVLRESPEFNAFMKQNQ
jgi:NTE family protein